MTHHPSQPNGFIPDHVAYALLASASDAYMEICPDGTGSRQLVATLAKPDPAGVLGCRIEAQLATMRQALRKHMVTDDQLAGAFLFIIHMKLRDIFAAPAGSQDMVALYRVSTALGLERDEAWEIGLALADFMTQQDGFNYRTSLLELWQIWRTLSPSAK